MTLHVAIAIVGFRNPADIAGCLGALGVSTYSDFEVVICENGGEAAYAALVAQTPKRLASGQTVTILSAPRNLGFAGGVNRCLEHTPDADAWWILNPDTLPEPPALERMVDRLSAGGVDAVGCTVHLPDGTVQSWGGLWRPVLARSISMGHGAALETPIDAAEVERRQNYLNGSSMLVSAGFVRQVGLMREDYFLYCEEVEWFIRGARHGMGLGFAPRARVLHHVGSSTGMGGAVRGRARLPVYLNARNAVLLVRDTSPWALPVAVAALCLQMVARFGRHRAWRQLRYALSGILAGVANERGAPAWLGSVRGLGA